MSKSRIPEPLSTAELKKYRWRELLPELGLGGGKIPIVNRVPVTPATTVPPAQIQMGETSAPHVFATSPGGGLPTLSQKVWGYAEAGAAISYLGPVVLAQEDVPVKITWQNSLPDQHPFVHPMSDLAAPGSMMSRYSTGHAVVHMHGARVEDGCGWLSDAKDRDSSSFAASAANGDAIRAV